MSLSKTISISGKFEKIHNNKTPESTPGETPNTETQGEQTPAPTGTQEVINTPMAEPTETPTPKPDGIGIEVCGAEFTTTLEKFINTAFYIESIW